MRASPGLGTYTDHESDVCRAAERLREAEVSCASGRSDPRACSGCARASNYVLDRR
jgi:hypothetical protein